MTDIYGNCIEHNVIDKNNALEKQNLDLKVKVVTLENQLTDLLRDNNISEDKIIEFINSLNNVEELNIKIRCLQTQLDEARKNIIENSVKKNNLKNNEDNYKRKIAELNSKIAVLESRSMIEQPTVSSKSFQQLKLDNSKLKREISNLESVNAEQTVQILNLQSKIKDMEDNGSRDSSEVNRLKRLIDEYKGKITVLQQEKIKMSEKIDDMNDKIFLLHSQNGGIHQETESLKQTLKTNNILINNVVRQILNKSRLLTKKIEAFSVTISDKAQNMVELLTLLSRKTSDDYRHKFSKIQSKNRDNYEASNIALTRLASLCATIVNLPSDKVPQSSDLISDPIVLDSYIDLVENTYAVNDSRVKLTLNSLCDRIKKYKRAKDRTKISTDVLDQIYHVQSSISEMTKTLENDHRAMIDAIEAKRLYSK